VSLLLRLYNNSLATSWLIFEIPLNKITAQINDMLDSNSLATASLENLYRIFTVPEAPNSTLGSIDKEISDNLMGFLTDRIVAREKSLTAIEADFSDAEIPEVPQFVSEYTDFVCRALWWP